MTDVLISIRPRFVADILTGSKQVEIRRRALRVPKGTRLWIYCTKPVGSIVAVALVESTKEGDPEALWQEVGEVSGMTKSEYIDYVNGATQVSIIRLQDPRKLKENLDLDSLRQGFEGFHPPQFAKRLASDGPLLTLLTSPFIFGD